MSLTGKVIAYRDITGEFESDDLRLQMELMTLHEVQSFALQETGVEVIPAIEPPSLEEAKAAIQKAKQDQIDRLT